jgi:hypothetical protein
MSLLLLGVSGDDATVFDADALAYLTATNNVDATQRAATNTLVKGLKTDGTWPLFYFFYPFMGPTSGAYHTNLINPATFTIIPGAPMNYDSHGFSGNGMLLQYGDTGFNPSVHMSQDSKTYSINIYTDATANVYDFGVDNGAQQRGDMLLSAIPGNELYPAVSQAHNLHYTISDPKSGEFTITRNVSTELKVYRDGVFFVTSVQNSTVNPNGNMYICANNNGGTPTLLSSRVYRSFWAASGMNATQIANVYSRLQTFFTAVGK